MKVKMIRIVTALKSNMKPQIMTSDESTKLNKRGIIESKFNSLKNNDQKSPRKLLGRSKSSGNISPQSSKNSFRRSGRLYSDDKNIAETQSLQPKSRNAKHSMKGTEWKDEEESCDSY
jgi:hypothetical protein